LVGGAILGLYQYGLFSGIQEYIMTAPRVDLVSMNREGIFSMLGFYGIFLIAGQIGSELLLIQDIEKKRSSQHRTLLKYLIFFSGCLFACYQLDWQISRRMVL
jgi:phosphatidylinositol glycan class W